jgi:lysophospholipase L1-like esterase
MNAAPPTLPTNGSDRDSERDRVSAWVSVRRAVRDGWLVLGIAALLFLALEGTVRGLARVGVLAPAPSTPSLDPRANADTYRDREAARAYFDEFRRSDTAQWSPYTYWRRLPFSGRLINVDRDGLRVTPAPTAADVGPDALTIWVFGGSTVWGTGAEDEATIPSRIQQGLRARGIPAVVTNFGESGYVSTQEVVMLIRALQERAAPDVVLFYDGINDSFSAWQQQEAGLPQNEFNRVAEFNLSQLSAASRRRRLLLRDVAYGSEVVRRARALLASSRAAAPADAAAGVPARDSMLLAKVVSTYLANRTIVQALGAQYGFSSVFVWQPSIFEKASLTPYEQSQRDAMPGFGPFYQAVTRALRRVVADSSTSRDVVDLSTSLQDVREPLFIDWCHLGETGNALMAEQIVDRLVRLRAPRASR